MSNGAILAALAWQAAYSLAAPTPNTTATPIAEPGWKKEPKGRGTFSIIITSVLTLGLCVWTAIHPNVKPNATAWQKVKHRLWFVLLGMLAPEVVLAVAFYEWREARKFHQKWCDFYGVAPYSDEDVLRMKGAFFVTMGGVSFLPAYKVPANFENILSTSAYLRLARTNVRGEVLKMEDFKKLTKQTPHAMVEVAKVEEAVQLLESDPERSVSEEGEQGSTATATVGRGGSEELGQSKQEQEEEEEAEMVIKREFVHYREVQDKGKAEVLGKTLVCLQALWMLVQCVVRKASGLPVTLLEIHVAMHVICAVGMYGFWFNKPQDVGEPLPVPGILSGTSDPMQLYVESMNQISERYQGHSLFLRWGRDSGNPEDMGKVPDNHYHRPLPTTKSVHFLSLFSEVVAQEIPEWGLGLRPSPPAVADPTRLVIPHGHVLDLGAVKVFHMAELWIACVMPSEDLDFLTKAAKAYEAGKRPKWPELYLQRHVSTGDAGDILDDIYISNVSPAIFILLLYGACHAAAWNTHFPSPAERLLWRISSCVIAVVPSYALFLHAMDNSDYETLSDVFTLYLTRLYRFLKAIGHSSTDGTRRRQPICIWWRRICIFIYCIIIYPPLLAVIAAVPLGRIYLFIESFLCLRSLPYGSFDSTPWEDYFPHF